MWPHPQARLVERRRVTEVPTYSLWLIGAFLQATLIICLVNIRVTRSTSGREPTLDLLK